MDPYPMLDGVDPERVFRVGGKAALLEEMIRRWPEAPVPAFTVFDGQEPSVRGPGKYVFRASSELDILGGCGLHETVSRVTESNFQSATKRILRPDSEREAKLRAFAESIGKEYSTPTVMAQVEGKPKYWAVALQHPNDPEILLISYSSDPTVEFTNPASVRRAVGGRTTHSVVCSLEGETSQEHEIPQELVRAVTQMHRRVLDLGMVDPKWTSISELGVYDNRVEVYQSTPIRKQVSTGARTTQESCVEELIIGATEPFSAPIVRMPRVWDAWSYLHDQRGWALREHFSDFAQWADELVVEYPAFTLAPELFGPIMVRLYTKSVEGRYPEGYIVVADMDDLQEFDIPMQKARAVFIGTTDPVRALSHNTARLMYKAPVVIIGDAPVHLSTGTMVEFSSDGASYKLNEIGR